MKPRRKEARNDMGRIDVLARTAKIGRASCTLQNRVCAEYDPERCKRCGWTKEELARRAKLPLRTDDKGKARKFVGIRQDQKAQLADAGKNCQNCDWFSDEYGTCTNGDSPWCADYPPEPKEQCCYNWELRKGGGVDGR